MVAQLGGPVRGWRACLPFHPAPWRPGVAEHRHRPLGAGHRLVQQHRLERRTPHRYAGVCGIFGTHYQFFPKNKRTQINPYEPSHRHPKTHLEPLIVKFQLFCEKSFFVGIYVSQIFSCDNGKMKIKLLSLTGRSHFHITQWECFFADALMEGFVDLFRKKSYLRLCHWGVTAATLTFTATI